MTITVGVRSFRSTDSGAVRVSVHAEEDGTHHVSEVGAARIAESVGAESRLAQVAVEVVFESETSNRQMIDLVLEE